MLPTSAEILFDEAPGLPQLPFIWFDRPSHDSPAAIFQTKIHGKSIYNFDHFTVFLRLQCIILHPTLSQTFQVARLSDKASPEEKEWRKEQCSQASESTVNNKGKKCFPKKKCLCHQIQQMAIEISSRRTRRRRRSRKRVDV